MNRRELSEIGSKLGINCGGEGGTPGPCPTNRGATTVTKAAHKASQEALAATVKEHGTNPSKAHHVSDAEYATKQSSHAMDASSQKLMGRVVHDHESAAREHAGIAKKQSELGYSDVAAAHQKAANAHKSAIDYRHALSRS